MKPFWHLTGGILWWPYYGNGGHFGLCHSAYNTLAVLVQWWHSVWCLTCGIQHPSFIWRLCNGNGGYFGLFQPVSQSRTLWWPYNNDNGHFDLLHTTCLHGHLFAHIWHTAFLHSNTEMALVQNRILFTTSIRFRRDCSSWRVSDSQKTVITSILLGDL